MQAVQPKPRGQVGIYLFTHAHEWSEVGAHRWKSGEWTPVFRCLVCGDVVTTTYVPDSVPPVGSETGSPAR